MEKRSFRIGMFIGVFTSLIFFSFMFSKMAKTETQNLKKIQINQIQIETLENKKINLKTGKPTIINFWSSWCAPCVEEFPEFEKLKLKYKDRIEIKMVSDEKIEKILNFKNKNSYTLDFVHNLKGVDYYGIKSLPATYFYNSNGKLIKKINGALNEKELNDNIELLFN